MTKKILHTLVGTLVLAGCYTNLMASDMGIVKERAKGYAAPVAEAQVTLRVFEGEEFEIQQEVDGYYEIIVENEIVYVEKEYIAVQSELKEEVTEEEVKEEVKAEVVSQQVAAPAQTAEVKVSTGEKIVSYAKQFIGTPYVYGGNNLKTGVDCSGFTQQVFKNFGINLQRTSRSQYASNGYAVTKSQLQPGDLVFYGYGSSITHVAIYIGNSQIIHAPAPGQKVRISPLWQRGDAPVVGYKRVVK